jgi:hypothetical protein
MSSYINISLRDSSLLNLFIHSAIVAANEMTRILLHFSPSCDNGIELVTTSSSISELFNLSIAGPDKTG